MGMTTMLTTCLLSIGGSFKSAGQAPLSDSWLQLIDSSFGILEKLCHFDLKEIQNMISPPTELYHLLLFSMQQHTVQQSPVLTSIIENVARLVGHVFLFNIAFF
jgi:hypothetical protein